MAFIKLHVQESGDDVFINTDTICRYGPWGTGSFIHFIDGSMVQFSETLDKLRQFPGLQ